MSQRGQENLLWPRRSWQISFFSERRLLCPPPPLSNNIWEKKLKKAKNKGIGKHQQCMHY